jgi:hypothetical protein
LALLRFALLERVHRDFPSFTIVGLRGFATKHEKPPPEKFRGGFFAFSFEP